MSSFHLSFAPFVFLHPYALYSSGRCALSECCSQLPMYSESISSHLHSIVPSAPIHFRYSRFQDLVVPQCYQLSVAMYVEWSPLNLIFANLMFPHSDQAHLAFLLYYYWLSSSRYSSFIFFFRYHRFSGDVFGFRRRRRRRIASQPASRERHLQLWRIFGLPASQPRSYEG